MIQTINSTMKIQFRHTRVFTFLLTLLLLCGVANQAWAYKVTYHILTKPINNSIYHMSAALDGKRLEAVRVVDNNASTVNLPDAYKSPLATNFKYYESDNVTKEGPVRMYDWGDKDMTYHYTINDESDGKNKEGSTVESNDIHIYVTYEYNSSNTIADLSGSKEYNLTMSGGFWGFNRGRNNRIAVFQKKLDLVKNEALVSEDFVQFPYTDANLVSGTTIKSYWQDNNNKNTKSYVAGQFHFIFKFEGSDPYNIIIGTAYDKDYTYIEKHGSENSFRYKWYKGSHLFRPSSDGTGFFMSSDDHWEYTTPNAGYNPEEMPSIGRTQQSGYFKSKGIAKDNLNYSTFALLNNSNTPCDGYVFMVSRFVNTSGDLSDPGDYKKAKYNYLTRDGNYNNLTYYSLTLSDASKNYSTDPKIYRVQKYVYKVTKKISGGKLAEKLHVSEYFLGEDPVNFIPEALKRKYVTYKAYSNAGMTNEVTTFTNAAANCVDDPDDDYPDCKVIYLDYDDSEMPFKTWKKANPSDEPDYDEMKWYNLQADKNSRYVTFLSSSDFNTYQSHSRNGYDSHFAFVGDPYDLKIVSRKATVDASRALRYLAFATGGEDAWKGNITYNATPTVWEMKYDDNTGDYAGCFRLNESGNTDKNLSWNFGTGSYPLIGSATTAVRLTVINLPTINYNYYIMRSDQSIAVMTQAFQEPGVKLDYDHIPEVIRSPFLEDVKGTIKFYGGFTGDDAEEKAINAAKAGTDEIDYAPDVSTGSGNLQYIVIRYDFSGSSNRNNINGDESTAKFNVRLNGQYIYYDSSNGGTIKSSATIEDKDGDGNLTEFDWILGGSDPYTLNIKSVKANKFIAISENALPTGDEAGGGTPVTWSESAPSLKYIVKLSSKDEGQTYYEVMAATGQNRNALDETFNFGRPADNTVKMYSDWSYVRGGDVLRFQLTKNTAVNVTYHLVDKSKNKLLEVKTRQEPGSAPSFPPDYRSPLVETYTYWSSLSDAQSETGTKPTSVAANDHIYVTYTANNLVDMSGRTMYLLKYALGDQFRQEDGSDGVSTVAQKAVYPYCNGDCNFFVYGQEQYDEQQQGAASTRTRWAWYVESVNNDPYHVKIRSRQQETYPAGSGNDYNAYFRTYKPNGYSEVVTTLAWPGISGEQGTEYMVLGSARQFRLVTTYGIDLNNDGDRSDPGEDERRAVNSFEQYWKTWNTIRLKVLGDKDAVAKQSDPNTVPATPAAPTAAAASKDNRTYLTGVMGWHSYENWAYAIRWNDYNKDGDKNKKGWEALEHWYQTVNMGEGYFDFVPTTIDPVLILLDQHGWEVMRKPLPSSPNDPEKDAKYDAIRPYDSPMVKEYHFWTKTSKRSGFHQYHTLGQQVTVDGKPFTSTSLTSLPPFDATNVHDAKGNMYDQYVTYTVKDEYLKACNVTLSYTENVVDPADSKKTYSKVTATVTGVPFLIQQGNHFVSATNATTLNKDNDVPTTGGMSQYIIDNANKLTPTGDKKNELWYLMPNLNIDNEMGYDVTPIPAHNWASDYDREDKVQTSGFNSWAFDPYNIQISSVAHSSSYFVTDATTAEVYEGSILGNGETNALGARQAVKAALVGGWDNRTIRMTNATFMAVQDKNGNMQLMPRFDQEKRLKDFTGLVHTDDPGVAQTYTKLYRPLVYNYHIIDNSGSESLRYQGGGDLVPQTPDWFKSPLAKDYKYYKNLTKEGDVYTEVKNKTDISAKEITESLEGAAPTGYDVYVRYSYDESADNMGILKGKWLTMDVNENDAQYTTVSVTAGIYSGTKPETVDGSAKEWQWKFLANSQTDPDPYAVSLYNRNNTPGEPTAVNIKTKFALLNWYNGTSVDASAYTLAVHGLGTVDNYDYTYQFVNGAGMDASTAATTDTEDNVKSTSCSYANTYAKIELDDDVSHTYIYKVYTNDDPDHPAHGGKYGVFAVSASQDYFTVSENDYVPILPAEIKSPLLNIDQFKYYGAEADMGDATRELKNIFGLYEDNIYVRYTDYDLNKTEYKVPNVKTVVDSKVARGETSNDAALDINNELLYNIFWHEDEIMKEDEGSIKSVSNQELHSEDAYVWKFEGNDPYSIKIKHNKSGKYAVGADALADGATSTFMLLPSTDSEWQYGVLQVTGTTGNSAQRLTDHGETLTADASTEPTKFIIFGLSTHTVIYHLLIAKTCPDTTNPKPGEYIDIPYRETEDLEVTTKRIYGSSQRDLTSVNTGEGTHYPGEKYQLGTTINGLTYCVNQGHITLGDSLKVPDALKRPNCKYFYYVEGVYTNIDCSREIPYGTEGTHIDALDAQYRGLQIKQMGTEPGLLGKTVRINVEYQFDDGLPTNNGTRFVTNTNGTQWYTFETNDETPYLANFTYKDNIMKGKEGRIGHYTNEFLWSPVGDPYGFKMYNRYVYKNGGQPEYVMTTAAAPAADVDLNMSNSGDVTRTVFELLPGDTIGYFKVPTLTIPGSATTYYLDNTAGTLKLKESTDTETEWTFGLSDALLEPYYLGAGNVGGLTTEPKSGTGKSGVKLYEEAATLMAKQEVVFNPDNIVDFTPGYYRIFNQPNSQGITIPRYLSGYTHKTELNESIPMHFYEKKGVTTTFEALGSGFTTTAATQGQIPIVAPEYDPASIFYITGTASAATMSTQGLNVIENKMGTTTGTTFHIIDIGGAVVLLHDGAAAAVRKYLHYKQDTDIYDVKYQVVSGFNDDDAAKWCMEPANKMGLYIETHSGGEEEVLTTTWYYSTYCVPFDMLIANKTEDEAHSSNAYTCVAAESPWPGTAEEARKGLHPKPIGKYNAEPYQNNDYFVPAGTPVIFSTKRATEYIKATIPTTAPSTRIETIFSAKYLEQKLPDWNDANRVYVFGPKMEGTMNINASNGDVTATLPSLGNTNVGFHLNANPNKEAGTTPASWTRHNYYVLHNRIYYKADGGGVSAPAMSRGIEFVPVIFDDEEEQKEMNPNGTMESVGDGCIYDLMGRKVATREQVEDGSWWNQATPGVYILNGRKVIKK